MNNRSIFGVASILSLTVMGTASAIPAYSLIGSVNSTKLIGYDTTNPALLTSQVALSGFLVNEQINEIDFRPSNGKLYGMGTKSLYTINPTTGQVAPVGAPFEQTYNNFGGFDVDPVADKIHYVNISNGLNYTIDPDTGVIVRDSDVAYASGDARFGKAVGIGGMAYNNNVVGSGGSTQYLFDFAGGYGLATGNGAGGVLNSVGNFVSSNGFTSPYEFDIAPTGQAFIIANSFFNAGNVSLYSVNLGTGGISNMGVIGGNSAFLNARGLAIPAGSVPEPTSMALLTIAATAGLRRRR